MIKVKRIRAGEYTCFLHGEKLELVKRNLSLGKGVFWVARTQTGATVATADLLSGLRAKLSKIPTPKAPEHTEKYSDYRREYSAIMKRSGLDSKTFNERVKEQLAEMGLMEINNDPNRFLVQNGPTPSQYVEAAKQVTVPCVACNGTGTHSSGGKCYRCNGKGAQDDADRRRNFGYDERRHSVTG